MKKVVLIAIGLLLASSVVRGEVAASRPASRPSLAGLLAESRKHESAGRYAHAAKSARAAMAIAHAGKLRQVPQIRKQLRRLARRECSLRRLDALAAVLVARPDDMAIRERAINICIIELDNPARAAAFVNEDTDQILQTYVPMAAQSIDKIAEAPCRELAEWYINNLKKPSRFGRVAMLRRVAGYYGRFLKLHKSDDAERRAATEKYELAVRQLADLGEKPSKAPL
ncbi:MAG: hypothetical protein ISS69_11670 [Phycisphaerae bacterium]|nr:hypothetical protein [Phycisphaerae bacterium]